MPNYTPEQRENARKLYLKLHAQGENPTAKRIADEMGMPLRYIQNLMSPSNEGWRAEAEAIEAETINEALGKLGGIGRAKKVAVETIIVMLANSLRSAKAGRLKFKDSSELAKGIRALAELHSKTAEHKKPAESNPTQIGTLNVLNVGKLDDKARDGLNALLDAAHGQVAVPAEVVEESEACAS